MLYIYVNYLLLPVFNGTRRVPTHHRFLIKKKKRCISGLFYWLCNIKSLFPLPFSELLLNGTTKNKKFRVSSPNISQINFQNFPLSTIPFLSTSYIVSPLSFICIVYLDVDFVQCKNRK